MQDNTTILNQLDPSRVYLEHNSLLYLWEVIKNDGLVIEDLNIADNITFHIEQNGSNFEMNFFDLLCLVEKWKQIIRISQEKQEKGNEIAQLVQTLQRITNNEKNIENNKTQTPSVSKVTFEEKSFLKMSQDLAEKEKLLEASGNIIREQSKMIEHLERKNGKERFSISGEDNQNQITNEDEARLRSLSVSEEDKRRTKILENFKRILSPKREDQSVEEKKNSFNEDRDNQTQKISAEISIEEKEKKKVVIEGGEKKKQRDSKDDVIHAGYSFASESEDEFEKEERKRGGIIGTIKRKFSQPISGNPVEKRSSFIFSAEEIAVIKREQKSNENENLENLENEKEKNEHQNFDSDGSFNGSGSGLIGNLKKSLSKPKRKRPGSEEVTKSVSSKSERKRELTDSQIQIEALPENEEQQKTSKRRSKGSTSSTTTITSSSYTGTSTTPLTSSATEVSLITSSPSTSANTATATPTEVKRKIENSSPSVEYTILKITNIDETLRIDPIIIPSKKLENDGKKDESESCKKDSEDGNDSFERKSSTRSLKLFLTKKSQNKDTTDDNQSSPRDRKEKSLVDKLKKNKKNNQNESSSSLTSFKDRNSGVYEERYGSTQSIQQASITIPLCRPNIQPKNEISPDLVAEEENIEKETSKKKNSNSPRLKEENTIKENERKQKREKKRVEQEKKRIEQEREDSENLKNWLDVIQRTPLSTRNLNTCRSEDSQTNEETRKPETEPNLAVV